MPTAEYDVVVAGGMESMTEAPYLLPNARRGYKYGGGKILDATENDALTDAYDQESMGASTERHSSSIGIANTSGPWETTKPPLPSSTTLDAPAKTISTRSPAAQRRPTTAKLPAHTVGWGSPLTLTLAPVAHPGMRRWSGKATGRSGSTVIATWWRNG